MTVAGLLLERLAETSRTTADLAGAVQLPAHYLKDLVSGRRRPPLPSRTDLYDKMTRFLRLGRTDLADCATAERARDEQQGPPDAEVSGRLLELCEPETARRLKRPSRVGRADLNDAIGRVLAVVYISVRRSLDTEIGLRAAAMHAGVGYDEMRLRVIEFLDTSPATVTVSQLDEFVRPLVKQWDMDSTTGVLRVVLRPAAAGNGQPRRPIVRSRMIRTS